MAAFTVYSNWILYVLYLISFSHTNFKTLYALLQLNNLSLADSFNIIILSNFNFLCIQFHNCEYFLIS